MRESSNNSLTSRVRLSTSVSMRTIKRLAAGGSSRAPSSKVSVNALRLAKGVRNSCETFEIKSLRMVSSRCIWVRSWKRSIEDPGSSALNGIPNTCKNLWSEPISKVIVFGSPSLMSVHRSTIAWWRITSTTDRPSACDSSVLNNRSAALLSS